MYVTPPEYSKVYKEITRTSLSHSNCKLIIFVSCLSIDALCSAKILSTLFKKELIQYQLIPVVGYTDLKSHYDGLDPEVVNVILIGCGAMVDLESFFQIDPDELLLPDQNGQLNDDRLTEVDKQLSLGLKRRLYIIDGHRPWNLDNIFGSSVVICFDDGFIDTHLKKEKEAYEALTREEDNEANGVESQADGDIASGSDDVENDENDEDEETDVDSRKRPKSHKPGKRYKVDRQANEDIIDSYYNHGTTVTSSNTASVYAILTITGETNIENLWLAIIGTSSLDDRYPEVYDRMQPLFNDEVLRLSPSSSSNEEKTADTVSLKIIKDYHLFLMRHWTLYDSFFHSAQVNSKLNLWTEEGRKKLHKLFAKMGIALAIAQQNWLYMDTTVKRQLPQIFKKYLPMYGLEDVVIDGFLRTYGYSEQLSAMEAVEALTALLELGGRAPDKNIESLEDRVMDGVNLKEKTWIGNFWLSWDALTVETSHKSRKDLKGLLLLMKGLERAKQIQQITFKTGMSVLERKLIKNLRLYRLCVLNGGSITDLDTFTNPLMLAKLGSWLLDNITMIDLNNNAKTLRPLIVASLNVASDVYLVIGLVPKFPRDRNEDYSTTRLNTFSVAFQQVANSSGAKVKIDNFDSSVIEIKKDDLSPFLERLTLSGII